MGAGVEHPALAAAAAAGRDTAIGSLIVRFRGLEATGDGREVATATVGVVATDDAKSSPKTALNPLPG